MKTKNIFKTLVLAAVLVSACDKHEIANNDKGYSLPVTINVTREGDNTKATYNESTRKLEFSAGDKLFVNGSATGAGSFAGALDYVPATGKFSGTIYTKNDYDGTADALFSAASSVRANLLPAGYESYNFLYINNKNTDVLYDDEVRATISKAFVASETAKKTGVEQLSWEQAYTYSSGFALAPANAVLNFTISGLEAGEKAVTLYTTYSDMEYMTQTMSGSVTPNASGVATFAIGVPNNLVIKNVANNLTIGSSNFTLPGGTALAAGKIYNITRSAAPAPSYTMAAAATTSDKGKLICTAGHIHVYGEDAACTAGRVAKIIYVGTNGHATYNHGLALALQDMSTKLTWDNSGANNDDKTAAEWCSAWNTSTPVTDAEWLLASKDQWDYMLGTNGAGSYTTLRDGFTSVGGSNMLKGNYWSSTENGTDNAWNYYFGNYGGGQWFSSYKNYINGYNVRACLAF